LPAREQTAVVMCYLDGVTYADAAQQLRCPLGTLAARLSRARDRLRARLTREGLAPSAEVFPVALAGESLPPALVTATVRGATALKAGAAAGVVPASVLSLMEGVRRAMLMQTWKVALAVLVVLGATGGGVGVIVARTAGPQQNAQAPERAPQASRPVANSPPQAEKPPVGGKQIPLALLRQLPQPRYMIGPGDVLGIYVEGVLGEKDKPPPVVPLNPTDAPATGYPIRVQENGEITLPLIGQLSVRGRSVSEVHDVVARAYVDQNILVRGKERVIISVIRPRRHRVTVVRRDIRGTPAHSIDLPALENDVLNALVNSGGVPAPNVDVVISIQRHVEAPDGSRDMVTEFKIPLKPRAGENQPFGVDCVLESGAVMIVEFRQPDDQAGARRTDSPPVLTLAVASPDGRILVQLPDAGGNGPWQLFDAAKVPATESDGRAVDAKSLAERLKSMTTVLVATDGRAPTTAHLQAVKPGTLVLTVQTTH
jgi:protein involved in polysaccharide export with SLBB domain